MRSTWKLIFVATMAIFLSCDQPTAAQRSPQGKLESKHGPQGKLELKPDLVIFDSASDRFPITSFNLENARSPPCCLKLPPCAPCVPTELVQTIGIRNMAILGQGSEVPPKVSFKIYSGKTGELLFSTKTCVGCGKRLSSKVRDNSIGYLLTLDSTAASAAEPHFVEGNKIVVTLKAKDNKDAPVMFYLVNAKEGKPAK